MRKACARLHLTFDLQLTPWLLKIQPSPSSNDITSSFATPLQQPASRNESCCARIIVMHRHPRAPKTGEWSMCELISLWVSNHTPASLLTRQGTAVYPEVGAEHPCSRHKLAQQLFKTEDLLRLLGLAGHGWVRPRRPRLLGSQQRSRVLDACRRPMGRLNRSEVRTAT